MKTKIVITLTALLVLIGINAKVQNDNQDPGTTSIVGDLNNDNKVNAADIVLLINNLKSKTGDQSTTLPDGTYAKEDVNKDGYVNESDLKALVALVMKGSTGDDPLKDLKGEELYEVMTTDLYDFLSTHEGATIEDIQAEIAKYPSSVTSEVRDNILYLRIDDTYDFICDPYRKTCLLQSDDEINEIDIESLQEEITNALYPQDINTRSDSFSNRSFSRSLTEGTDDRSVLNKREVLIWDPWALTSKFPKIKGIKITPLLGRDATLDAIKTFNKYDVVYMCCHGTPDGDIKYPVSNSECNIISGTGDKCEKGRIVGKEELMELIPSAMSRTILWTAICWGYNSHLKEIALNNDVVAFAGCDNQSVNHVPEYPFENYLLQLYSGVTVLDAAMHSIPIEIFGGMGIPIYSSIKRNPIVSDYFNFIDKKENIPVKGKFYFFCKNTEITGKVTFEPLKAFDGRPFAELVLPKEWYNYYYNTRATRALTKSGLSYGLWLKNKGTGKITEVEFDQHRETVYKRYDYKDMISRLELLGDTTGLESGIYEYRTYLEIDGEKTYSNDTFEFIKGENFCPDDHHPHVVDLGLPSGIKWACCNMGADFPEMYGDRYASGEVEPKTEFSQENYLVDMNISGCFSATQYDPAYTHWGKDWRLPTSSEIYELLNACTEESAEQNGVLGVKITGGTGNSIFLPSSTSSDYYLTGDCKSNTVHTLHFFNITSYLTIYEYENTLRFGGYPIRPVYAPGFKEMSVTTLDASDEKVYSATISGKVENTHWRNATEIGFYFNTTGDPKEGNGDYIAINKTGVFSYNLKNLEPATTYYYVAAAKTLGSTHYGDVKSFTTVKRGVPSRSTLFVDLGLSVIWAGWNVDATSPTETGSYFPWGMTREPIYIDYYVYDHRDGDSSTYPYTKDIGENISGTKYDAARENMKSAWRIPTIEEWDELLDRCTIENYTLDDVNGVTVTGPNGNCIFLPLTGLKWFGTVRDNKTIGYYWSATNAHKYNDNYNSYAYRIRFNLGTGSSLNTLYKEDGRKFFGLPIRAVKNR